MPSLRVVPIFSTLRGHDVPLLPEVARAFLERTGVELVPQDVNEAAQEPLLAILLLTGGTEAQALELIRSQSKPVLLLSHPAHNSLPAALETLAALKGMGKKARLFHLSAAEDLPLVAQAAQLGREIRGKRVGLVGQPSPWLVASSPDPQLLQERLGLEIVSVPIEQVFAAQEEDERPSGVGLGVGEGERRMAARVLGALRRIVESEKLWAFSLECFGLLPQQMTACWALAQLSAEGIPAGCEGDLPSLLGLILSQLLTGGPGFLANPADVDKKNRRLLLAHCTVPLTLVEDYTLRSHFESGNGLAVAGRLRPGPYTLVRFGGARLEKAFFVEGTVLSECPGREDLCRTQAYFKMPEGALEKLLREPLGNHHVLIPGHHRAVLEVFHELFLA